MKLKVHRQLASLPTAGALERARRDPDHCLPRFHIAHHDRAGANLRAFPDP